MNSSRDFPEATGTGNAPPNRPRKSTAKGSCLRLFLLVALCSAAFALLLVLLIDVTNSGGRIKRLIARALDIEPAPAVAPADPEDSSPGNGETDSTDSDTSAEPEVRVVEKIVEVPVEKVVEKIVEVEVKEPLPSGYVPWKKIDTATLWNGIEVETKVDQQPGGLASKVRESDESYRIRMEIALTIPEASDSVEELGSVNPHLPEMFPDFAEMVEAAEVSPFYHHLYERKTKRIQETVTRFDRTLSRHNLYDLETALQIEHPGTSRKVLLVQGDMDVVSDGSDGDRWPELDDYISMSDHYQPFTSYGWPKQTDTPNPLLARWEERLEELEEEFAIPGLSIERNRYLRAEIAKYKPGVADLKHRSFLIAEADPFVVVPLSLLGRRDENEFAPAIGDYAVVVHEDKLYPAIAGDAGPIFKFGEASLRLARALNEKASPYNRPVSDLAVTYLYFPGTAEEEKGPPDLDLWHQRCSTFLDELGGLAEGYSLHQWEDLIATKRAESEEGESGEADAKTGGEDAERETPEDAATSGDGASDTAGETSDAPDQKGNESRGDEGDGEKAAPGDGTQRDSQPEAESEAQ